MIDISLELSQALQKPYRTKKFLKKFNADVRLDYAISSKSLSISQKAMVTLEDISRACQEQRTKDCLAIEMAATALLDNDRIVDVIRGELGTQNYCDWEDGTLLDDSYATAATRGYRVSLGHTHPVFNLVNGLKKYGALPSKVKYGSKKLINSLPGDEKIKQALIDSKLYRKFGADYCEIYVRSQLHPIVSPISWIMSPALDQLGFFEVKEGGKVEYLPWQVS